MNYHLFPRYPTVEGEGLSPVDGHHGVVQVGVLEAALCCWKDFNDKNNRHTYCGMLIQYSHLLILHLLFNCYVQGLFLLLLKVIFFVEHLIFIKSYYRGCLLFTEARPFGPMMVKIIPRLFINTIFNCP